MPKLHYASQVVGNLGDNLGSGVDTQGAYSSHASPARKIRGIFAQLLDFSLFSDLLALPGGARVVYVKQGLRNGTVSVRLSVRPSVCPSMGLQQQTLSCRFAAVGPARRRYRSIAARRAAAATCGGRMRVVPRCQRRHEAEH